MTVYIEYIHVFGIKKVDEDKIRYDVYEILVKSGFISDEKMNIFNIRNYWAFKNSPKKESARKNRTQGKGEEGFPTCSSFR